MPVFTSKTNTDPGPFDAVPAPEKQATVGTEASTPPEAHGQTAESSANPRPAPDDVEPAGSRVASPRASADPASQARATAHAEQPATDDDDVLDRLYRFREIAVTAEMRRELLGAKLPLASLEQLADTQPPNRSALNAPPEPRGVAVNRNAPTEPNLSRSGEADRRPRTTPPEVERTPASELDIVNPSYSTTAPTLLSVRRRRSRNRRLVGGFVAALGVALVAGAFLKLLSAHDASDNAASGDRGSSLPYIAGNRPATPPNDPAGARAETADGSSPEELREAPSDAEIAQPSVASPDSTLSASATAGSVSAPKVASSASFPVVSPQSMADPHRSTAASSADPGPAKAVRPSAPASVPQQPATAGPKSDGAGTRPSPGTPTRKGFDPEELIF